MKIEADGEEVEITGRDLLKYRKITYDQALPDAFYDDAARLLANDKNNHPWYHFVWAYPNGHIFGMPCALNSRAERLLKVMQVPVYMDMECNIKEGT